MLGLNRRQSAINGQPNQLPPSAKFLQPKSECQYAFESVLDDLTRDPVYIYYYL